MSPDPACPACGYRLAAQAGKSPENCPRCGTSLGDDSTKPPEAVPIQNPSDTVGGLADLEFSGSYKTHDVKNEDSRPTHPRQREGSEKEITDRQGKESQKERLVIQEHLVSMANSPTAIQIDKPSQPKKKKRAARHDPPLRTPVRETESQSFFSAFGTILLVCFIFLAWVIYDQKGRPLPAAPSSRTDAILSQAVTSFHEGDRDVARELAERAMAQDPNSQLAKKLIKLFETPR